MMRKLKNIELNRISVEEYKSAKKMQVVLVLDNIRSLNNIGSVFRTADAFRVEKILLCGITGVPPHREIHKTALGATDSVKWEYFSSTKVAITQLKKSGYKIAAIEQMAESISLIDYKPDLVTKTAFIFGNEINGISDDVMDDIEFCLEIPQFGTKHSFNIAVSAGIVLWHFFVMSQIR